MVKCAFAQRFRCGRAVLCEDTLFDRTGIDTDADRNFLFAAHGRDGFYAVIAADVAGIDADGVDAPLCARQGILVVEVDIRDQGDRNLFLDPVHRLCRGLIRNGNADDLASGGLQRVDLLHSGADIVGLGIAHGLNRHWGTAAHGHIPHHQTLCHGASSLTRA